MAHAEHTVSQSPSFRVVAARSLLHGERVVQPGEDFPECRDWPHFRSMVNAGEVRLEGDDLPEWYRPRVEQPWQRAEEIPSASTREEAAALLDTLRERFRTKTSAGVEYGPGEANWFRTVLTNIKSVAPDLLDGRVDDELEEVAMEWARCLSVASKTAPPTIPLPSTSETRHSPAAVPSLRRGRGR